MCAHCGTLHSRPEPGGPLPRLSGPRWSQQESSVFAGPRCAHASRERSTPIDPPLFFRPIPRRCLVCLRVGVTHPRRPHAPLPLSLATALDSARRFAVQPMRPNEDGTSAVRSRGSNTSASLSRRTHPLPWCTALCAFWHRTALPKNRESRVRAIPRATPPVPHAPVPCAPLAVRFASRRGVGGDDGRSLRLSTSPASSEALEGPAEAERRRLPHVLALAGRRSRPDAAARPLTRHALPARPPI